MYSKVINKDHNQILILANYRNMQLTKGINQPGLSNMCACSLKSSEEAVLMTNRGPYQNDTIGPYVSCNITRNSWKLPEAVISGRLPSLSNNIYTSSLFKEQRIEDFKAIIVISYDKKYIILTIHRLELVQELLLLFWSPEFKIVIIYSR